jgi:flagellar biosynthesis protein FliR
MTIDLWTFWIVPLLLLLGRVSAFLLALPVFGWQMLPMTVRAGLAILVTGFFAMAGGVPKVQADLSLFGAALLLVQESLTGLALGLALNIVFQAARQAGAIAAEFMGLTDASVIDPSSGEESDVMAIFFEIAFVLLFLAAGGHLMMLRVLGLSYQAFPVGSMPDAAALADLFVRSGTDMLTFSLRLAAPLMGAFLLLTVALAVLSKAMPEVNVLFLSFPLRIGLCLLVAAAMMPALSGFTEELAEWMKDCLVA